MTAVAPAPVERSGIRESDVAIAGGRHLRVLEAGEPGMPALLFLHGSGPGVTARANWENVMAGLGDRFHCIAPDILGFGESSHADPQPQGFKANAEVRIDALLQMLDALGVSRVTVVGNSMGGMYSLRLCQLRPDLVEKMVLMGSGGMPGLAPTPQLIKLVTFFDDPSLEAMTALLTEFVHDKTAFGDRIEDFAAGRMALVTRPEIETAHRAMFGEGEMLSFSPAELARLDVPTLVVHGRQDVIVPIECSLYLAEHLPQADLYVMNNCGHWTQVEQPDRFRTILRDFADGRL
ncbi:MULTISPECIES: alpha/beta hydrolase [unclassified Nocardioides]|uniref:alpha/beta fold hydrolase n=1 Tax=unclassified Nocardioides TaxID=2615069 RepID=UPI000056F966|nr:MULTISPECIES: alpha/beta hydrolase [unclassified Nocardioides]ABL79753.1 alpha/beta hydrolase fold protein [Nocardioides sp. JS614]